MEYFKIEGGELVKKEITEMQAAPLDVVVLQAKTPNFSDAQIGRAFNKNSRRAEHKKKKQSKELAKRRRRKAGK